MEQIENAPQKKKVKKGCLIGAIVGIVFLVILIAVGIGGGDDSQEQGQKEKQTVAQTEKKTKNKHIWNRKKQNQRTHINNPMTPEINYYIALKWMVGMERNNAQMKEGLYLLKKPRTDRTCNGKVESFLGEKGGGEPSA